MERPPYVSTTNVAVSFGDCDPAGIVFYPRFFAWMDRAFHNYLRPLGGHADLCRRLGAVGIGLIKAEAQFRAPVRDGDAIALACSIREWGSRALIVDYSATLGSQRVLTGTETRGIFGNAEGRLFAAPTDDFRKLVEAFQVAHDA